jgi:hypothetical protein
LEKNNFPKEFTNQLWVTIKIIVIVKKNEKIGENKNLKIKHFGHPLWVTIIFILKKRLYGNCKERKKKGKRKENKRK